jgi:hypothetical protein
MASLYADYIKAREGFETLENSHGFAIYKIMDQNIYLKDIYILPEKRNSGHATDLADAISEIGITQGCTKLLGSVCAFDQNATTNMKVLLAYGFKFLNSTQDMIYFSKEL